VLVDYQSLRFADKCVDRYAPAALIHPNGGRRVFHLRKCVPVDRCSRDLFAVDENIFARRERKVRSVDKSLTSKLKRACAFEKAANSFTSSGPSRETWTIH